MYGWKWYMKDMPTPSGLTAFSLFASMGGSSLGYKLAEFDVLGGVEIDKRFARLYQHNLKPKFFWQCDIRDFNRLDNLPPQLYQLDVLDGSPPCSSFSIVGKREKFWGQKKKFTEGQWEQTLDDLVFEYCETVKKLRPKIVVMENVPGLIFSKAKPYAVEVIKRLEAAGYEMQLFKLNAALMGVPQVRERLFFVGNRMGYPKLKLEFNEPLIPFGEVRSEKGRPVNKDSSTAYLLEHATDKDFGLSSVRKRLGLKRSRFGCAINSDNKVSYTLKVSGDNYRLCDKTGLSNQDTVNIQSFPQDYDFLGYSPKSFLGYTVPPVMMYKLAREIRRQWLN